MTISELIERLEALKAEHGDLPVLAYDDYDEEWRTVSVKKSAYTDRIYLDVQS